MPKERPALDDLDRLAVLALDNLLQLTRDQAVQIVGVLCRDEEDPVWWGRALREQAADALCLGRFDIVNPDRADLPWPAVLIVLCRRALPGDPGRSAVAALYWSPSAEEWEVSVRDGSEVDWAQFAGDLDGEPGLVNGDLARGGVRPSSRSGGPRVESVAAPPRTPGVLAAAARPAPSPSNPQSSELLRLRLEIAARVLRLLEE